MAIHGTGVGRARHVRWLMRRGSFLGVLAWFTAVVVALVPAPSAAVASERPTVVAVNYPLAYFADRLAGGAVKVVLPVPAGRDPAFWRPAIADIASIQSADLILLNGAGFAAWTSKTSLPRSRVVDTSGSFRERLIATETVTHSHGPEGEHSHTGVASFTWLDLGLAGEQAAATARGLKSMLPEEAAAIDARLSALRAELAALDSRARAIGETAKGRRLIATHPRYQYFARAYGFAVQSMEWDAGAMPDENQWAALGELLGETPKAILLWEAPPPPEARERLRASGTADVVFPTLAMPPESGDFLTAFSQQIDRLAAALAR